MGDLEKHVERNLMEEEDVEDEEEKLLMEGMPVLDFDMLCSTVALQTQGKWSKLNGGEGESEEGDRGRYGNSAFRMWEGELLDCCHDHSIAIESLWKLVWITYLIIAESNFRNHFVSCPCYRFGKNMKRAGFGSCFLQGIAYCLLALSMLANFIAFVVTRKYCFLYLAVAFAFFLVVYLGFFRTQIKKKFNIRGTDSFLDDCFYHLFCPCCSLAQESRTLEMNNVQDGTWHGRGDICIGSYTEGNKAFVELHPPPVVSVKSPEVSSVWTSTDVVDDS